MFIEWRGNPWTPEQMLTEDESFRRGVSGSGCLLNFPTIRTGGSRTYDPECRQKQ